LNWSCFLKAEPANGLKQSFRETEFRE